MNNKGFTLIELLAVIIVLAIVSSITIMTVNGSLRNAKVKSERVFINNVTKATEAYIDENMTSGWGGVFAGDYLKYDIDKNECDNNTTDCKVEVYKRSFPFQKLIDSGYLKKDEVVNPNNKEKNADGTDKACYDDSTEVMVYRDSDYVYCFMVKLGCLGKQKANSSDETETDNFYAGVINTCPFNDSITVSSDNSYANSNIYYYTVDVDDNGKVYSDKDSKIKKELVLTPR